MEAKTMNRVTQANLDRLAETIAKALGNGKTYEAGQLFGLRWSFATGNGHELINMPTKTALYDAMHTFLEGVREAKQSNGGK